MIRVARSRDPAGSTEEEANRPARGGGSQTQRNPLGLRGPTAAGATSMGYLSEEVLAALEARLGIEFHDRSLLERALTHKSYRPEGCDRPVPSNERLEFLGDAVLETIVAAHLYVAHPDWTEGELTKVKAVVVSEVMLSRIGCELGLGEFLLLGKGEEQSGGRERPSLLANAVEALIAAVFLDRGGPDIATLEVPKFVLGILGSTLDAIVRDEEGKDYKTVLQELSQDIHKVLPTYHVAAESGPDHDKTFAVEAWLGDRAVGVGRGHSKKEAEQEAAKDALARTAEWKSPGAVGSRGQAAGSDPDPDR